jgi:hypothetical protein
MGEHADSASATSSAAAKAAARLTGSGVSS